MKENELKINYGGLKKLMQEMSKHYSVKVGLLSANGGSNEVSDNMDLAGLGAVQEFGARIPVTEKMRGFFAYKFGVHLKKSTKEIVIPPRSWLYAPILQHQDELRKKIRNKTQLGGSDIELLEEFISEYGENEFLEELAHAVGLSAFELIQEAFETNGFGEWQENNEITIAQKGSSMPLVDTGSLRQRITYEVTNNE